MTEPFEAAKRLQQLPTQFFATLVQKVNEQIQAGHDVINLGQGNPDQPTPPHIVRELQDAATNPAFHKYPPFSGYPFLKEAAAKRYKEDHGVELDPETEVAILFGGKTGLVEISHCLLNPGDTCLVPDPGYPDYWSGVALSEARMVMMPLLEQHDFLPDYSAISPADAEQAKLMFINYPNNPTGATADLSFYEETVRWAKQNHVLVVSDFAYGAIGFDGQRPVSFLQAEGAKEIGIEVYTLSKTYNMAGWRVGFAVGHPEIISLINRIQDHYYVSLFGGIQKAAATALTASQQCVEELVQRYESRRNTLFKELDRIGWINRKPAGSFFCWLKVPSGYTSLSFAELLLQEAKVAVAPGIGFGQSGEGYVRVGLLTSEERICEAVARIEKLGLFKTT
ncbi:pyridoxal phosphate-dependent aminotransferase [Marinicrinis sediminis]|uniref:Pyridoxal phosphate-dependent aminotransferase n=1 Tax=Marinicrinis sediminis TaxID=1652465 RepID=A0ABW5RDD6_9BACL